MLCSITTKYSIVVGNESEVCMNEPLRVDREGQLVPSSVLVQPRDLAGRWRHDWAFGPDERQSIIRRESAPGERRRSHENASTLPGLAMDENPPSGCPLLL